MPTIKKKNGSGQQPLGAEFWQNKVKSFRSSHLSQAEFCRQNDLRLSAFGYWNRKLHGDCSKSRIKKKNASQAHTGFIEISEILRAGNQAQYTAIPHIEVEIKNGWKVRIPASVNQETLRAIFMVMKESE
jgi:hypothetical protein